MTTDIDDRIVAFWQWIAHNADALRSMALQAERERDAGTLNILASAIYEKIALISKELVVDVHAAPEELTLAIRTARPDRSLVDQILTRAPVIPRWRFAAAIPADLESILVRTEDGRTFSFKHAAFRFALLSDQPGEKVGIVLVLDEDFDPDGPDAQVFQDIATHLLTTFLGRIPDTAASYRLIPARLAGPQQTQPLAELAKAWLAATGDP